MATFAFSVEQPDQFLDPVAAQTRLDGRSVAALQGRAGCPEGPLCGRPVSGSLQSEPKLHVGDRLMNRAGESPPDSPSRLSAIELRAFLDRELPDWLPTIDPVNEPGLKNAWNLSALDYLSRLSRMRKAAKRAAVRFDDVDVIAAPTVAKTGKGI